MSKSGSSMPMMVPLTKVVKWLIILNVGIWFIFQLLLGTFLKISFTSFFHLVPLQVFYEFKVWQVFTYMFLHSTDGVTHLLFNMLTLWFFGSELEQRWGRNFFLLYYLVCGVGAAVLYCAGVAAFAAFTGGQAELYIPVVGASGAIFGLMLAYGIVFGERVIHFFMVFPMKARYFVMLMGFVQLASLISSSRQGGEVAYLAHLSGLIVGFVFLWGRNQLLRFQWNQKIKKKTRNLRLVVNNEKVPDDSKGPKYWN